MANDDLTSVIDVADQYGKGKQTVFKILKRLGIEPTKRQSAANKNQWVSYITQDEFRRVSAEFQASADPAAIELLEGESSNVWMSSEIGVFYLIQLEPEHDPGRFKVGFAVNLPERYRALRCSAPFAAVVRSWPCRRLWERSAIDCVSAGCERLHTEVFRAASLEQVVARCDGFFAVMPPVSGSVNEP